MTGATYETSSLVTVPELTSTARAAGAGCSPLIALMRAWPFWTMLLIDETLECFFNGRAIASARLSSGAADTATAAMERQATNNIVMDKTRPRGKMVQAKQWYHLKRSLILWMTDQACIYTQMLDLDLTGRTQAYTGHTLGRVIGYSWSPYSEKEGERQRLHSSLHLSMVCFAYLGLLRNTGFTRV